MKWPLISDGSSQIEPNKREKSPSQVQGELMAPGSYRRQRQHEIIFCLVFFTIELSITSAFDNVFELE